MRTVFLATLVAMGIGLIGTASSPAAPANGAGIGETANAASLLSDVRYVRRHRRLCYSKCYREFVFGPRVCRTFC
jgi:hypothetical protein